ncbi:hypothetical protein EDC94DRAFT_663947 [Helicostylum pulchrum]|nr:hypothetical protein EDC94DRAFT_663947 [Helicostylum pulchrum]
MCQFVYEDGSGNLCDEQGTSVAIIDMEVDEDQYLLANITNFGEYTDLKPPEKPIKKSKIEQKGVVEKEKQLSVRAACKMVKIPPSTGQNWYKKGLESLEKEEDLPHVKEKNEAGRPPKL